MIKVIKKDETEKVDQPQPIVVKNKLSDDLRQIKMLFSSGKGQELSALEKLAIAITELDNRLRKVEAKS